GRRVQEQAAEEGAEFLEMGPVQLGDLAVGTALGGVCTLVGEPQNLLIGHEAGWHFVEFFRQVAPVSMPVLAAGLLACVL
ncbi:hypothetical protein ACV34X_30515, partial [Pseudomonas aeruginosa]